MRITSNCNNKSDHLINSAKKNRTTDCSSVTIHNA
jgi:hypothetical protein